MNHEDESLIENLKELTRQGQFSTPFQSEYEWVQYQVNPPVTTAELNEAERLLGYTLPPFLKRLYTEVGNGGFGPGYGLAQLFTPEGEDVHLQSSVVLTTLQYRGKDWPQTLLFICDWGCAIYSSIDCSTPQYPIIRSEQIIHICIEAQSLQQWLRAWLDGTPLFDLDWKKLPPPGFH